jgi:hypothetical protein
MSNDFNAKRKKKSKNIWSDNQESLETNEQKLISVYSIYAFNFVGRFVSMGAYAYV